MPLNPIDGRTELVGLIGWPVGHTMSPAMHNAAFEALGLNWRYVPLPVSPGQVEAALAGLGTLGFRGANVTVPHKQEVCRTLAQPGGPHALAPDAEALGAVNTLVLERHGSQDGQLAISGQNTDVAGFLDALGMGGFHPEGRSAVVVGAGGGARAVVFGLIQEEAQQVVVLNRTLERARALVSDLRSTELALRSPTGLHALPLTRTSLIDTARAADLLVNATPLGMWPRADRSIWPDDIPIPPHLTVLDLVYNPLNSKLLQQACAVDANALDGLEMLVRQGALAFEMWTGQPAPLGVMRQAAERSLKARSLS